MGLAVAVGECAQAFLQALLLVQEEVWVWPPEEAETLAGYARRLLKTLPGLRDGPSAWTRYAANVKEELYGLKPSEIDPCMDSNLKDRVWALRRMDD